MSKQPSIVPAQAVEVIIPAAILKLRDAFQKLGYRTTFDKFHEKPKTFKFVDVAYLELHHAALHLAGGTIVFEELVEGISSATLFHPLSVQPIQMYFYTDSGDFRSVMQETETLEYASFEEVFAAFPADSELWEDVGAQEILLTARRPKVKFTPVTKPLTREEILAKWQAQQEAFAATPDLDENDPGYVSGEAAAIDGAIQHGAEKAEDVQKPYHENFDIETKALDDKNWEASFKLRDGEQEYKATATAAMPDSEDLLDEDNEDAELGKIVDEREGQERVRVDIETL